MAWLSISRLTVSRFVYLLVLSRTECINCAAKQWLQRSDRAGEAAQPAQPAQPAQLYHFGTTFLPPLTGRRCAPAVQAMCCGQVGFHVLLTGGLMLQSLAPSCMHMHVHASV